MSTPASRFPGVFHSDPTTDTLVAHIGLVDGRITPDALTTLAEAVVEFDADHIQLTVHRRLEVPGIAVHHVDAFGARLVGAGLAAPTDVVGTAEDPQVGWFTTVDGQVRLGAVTAHGRLSAEQAKYVAAIGVPVAVSSRCEIIIDGVSEAVADTVVRVLAPLGFIFDANSEWATPTSTE